MTFSKKRGAHDLTASNPDIGGYYYRCRNGVVTIPVLHSLRPGEGVVSAFLDSLPTDTRIEFRCVLNPHLADALARRGYRRVTIPVPEMGKGEVDDCAWVRDAVERVAR